ncbi:MAG: DinB family protein [Candidatus Hatepunaea meridiana]|nr:DinB family protein [Candidatus Hatepunaea meridiana]
MLWINRKFEFDFPVDIYPEIIDRLTSTPARIEDIIRDVPAATLKMRHSGKWSIQEHIGHLINTETLFTGRLDDFEAGIETLRPADMTNRRTYEANHNQGSIEAVLREFNSARNKLIERIKAYPQDMFSRSANHPHLNKPMRMVDSLYFEAEHDDHHLNVMKELVMHFSGK